MVEQIRLTTQENMKGQKKKKKNSVRQNRDILGTKMKSKQTQL